MQREYIQVKNTQEELDTGDLVSQVGSLHGLDEVSVQSGVLSSISPFSGNESTVPKFQLIILTEGYDSPVEFLYRCDEQHMTDLENILSDAYPPTFDIERVDVDLLEKIVPPVEFEPRDFVHELKDGNLQYRSDVAGSEDDIREGGSDPDTEQAASPADSNGQGSPGSAEEAASSHLKRGTKADLISGGDQQAVDEPISTTAMDAQPGNFGQDVTSEVIDSASPLAELDSDVLADIDQLAPIEGSHPAVDIQGPSRTDEGTILARPSIEHGDPVSVKWYGVSARKQDWMTPLRKFSTVLDDEEGEQGKAPLSRMVHWLSETDIPVAFQTVFRRKKDWSDLAKRRKDNIHVGRDTLAQKISYEASDLFFGQSEERRRERRWNHMDDVGESTSETQSNISGQVGDRRALIDNKEPSKTFSVNMRAVSIATEQVPVDAVQDSLERVASCFEHLDGQFYKLKPEILTDTEGTIRSSQRGTQELHKFINGEIDTASGKKRTDIIANPDELANFIGVPSAKNLTTEGVRGTRAQRETRNPLPRPNPTQMAQYHEPGARIGYALDDDGNREPVPTNIPPAHLNEHTLIAGSTGTGKSKQIQNLLLSLFENTSGPNILIDPKGDGMVSNYMRSHHARFGPDSVQEDIIYFRVPEVLPGFSFFDITPYLNAGVDRDIAASQKAEHYEEILKLVMGRDRYEESKVAPTVIKSLIRGLFDEQHAAERAGRDSPNRFSHYHFEDATLKFHQAGVDNSTNVAADVEGDVPEVSDRRLQNTYARLLNQNSNDFSTIINAVWNRLEYVSTNAHLRKIFDNIQEQFDFREHLNDDKVILFDLGGLRDDATIIMTGLILSNLWDSVQEHDQTTCTQGHDDRNICEQHASDIGASPANPPCRETWDDDHLVNLIVDEASSAAVSDLMSNMLEKGRSFHLSCTLAMQYPGQMIEAADEDVYYNIFNNVHNYVIGKIKLTDHLAKALSSENSDEEELQQRIGNLPKGEWIAQLSTEFGDESTEPFSIEPLPIPAGHAESKNPLGESEEQRFQHLVNEQLLPAVSESYAIPTDDDPISRHKADPTDEAYSEEEATDQTRDSELIDSPSANSTDESESDHTDDQATSGDDATTSSSGDKAFIHQSGEGYLCTTCETSYDLNQQAARKCCQTETPNAGADHPSQAETTPEERDESLGNDQRLSADLQLPATIEDFSDIEPVISEWTQQTVSVIGAVLYESFDEPQGPARSATLERLSSLAAKHDVDHNGDPLPLSLYEAASPPPQPVAENLEVDTLGLVASLQAAADGGSQPSREPPSSSSSGINTLDSGGSIYGTDMNRTNIDLTQPDIELTQPDVDSSLLQPVMMSRKEQDQSPLNFHELEFLTTVMQLMNKEIESYNRILNLQSLRDHHEKKGADISKLLSEDYLIEHRFRSFSTFTVTAKGRKEIGVPLKQGPGVGDIGDQMPHRLGADLAKKYLHSFPDVDRCASFNTLTVSDFDESVVYDVIGYSGNDVQYVLEVEGGQTASEKESRGSTDLREGSKNYRSLRADADKMAAVEGADALWVVRNKKIGIRILRALAQSGHIGLSPDDVESEYKNSAPKFNEMVLGAVSTKGIDEILTFRTLIDDLS